jgi:phosphohistidine phosphatase
VDLVQRRGAGAQYGRVRAARVRLALSPELVLEHRLYLADPDQLLDVLRETPDSVESAAVIAHNPGLTELVNLLAGEPVLDNLPTFGVAAFRVQRPWVELRFGAGRLLELMSPKRLPDDRN